MFFSLEVVFFSLQDAEPDGGQVPGHVKHLVFCFLKIRHKTFIDIAIYSCLGLRAYFPHHSSFLSVSHISFKYILLIDFRGCQFIVLNSNLGRSVCCKTKNISINAFISLCCDYRYYHIILYYMHADAFT